MMMMMMKGLASKSEWEAVPVLFLSSAWRKMLSVSGAGLWGGIHEDQEHIPTPWHLETPWCPVGTVPLHRPLFIISKIILKIGLSAFFHHNRCLHCVFGWELALT